MKLLLRRSERSTVLGQTRLHPRNARPTLRRREGLDREVQVRPVPLVHKEGQAERQRQTL